MNEITIAQLEAADQLATSGYKLPGQSWQVDGEGSGSADGYAKLLSKKGWKPSKQYSKCSVASAEHLLEKGNARIEIISSNFLGSFVEISIWSI